MHSYSRRSIVTLFVSIALTLIAGCSDPVTDEELCGENGTVCEDSAVPMTDGTPGPEVDAAPQPDPDVSVEPELDATVEAGLDEGVDAEADGGVEPELDASIEPEPDANIEPEPMEPPTRVVAGLPRIHDFSGAPPERVDALIRRALEGLGLDAISAADEQDRVFVGRWYMAWIDETGFYGKINGLWALNGDPAALDFVLVEGDRPVNIFIVGERGDGRWPGGYKGAEHIEFPNSVPEPDDAPNCGQGGSFCSQYGLAEAPRYTDPDIAAWRACNDGSPSWNAHFEPIEVSATATGLRIMYEGPLTKQGDFGGSTDGNGCHEDFLFPDNIRRPVYLRVGYELDAHSHDIDRIMQVRNPAGNPVFDGPYSFIGGFVMTEWPAPHPLKRMNQWVRVDGERVGVDWSGERINFEPGVWTPLPDTVPDHDVVLGWAGQSVALSAFDFFARGQAFTIGNHGPEDNDDSGFCLCLVHGGIEMGGGLIHGAVDGGALSFEARRRLTVHHEAAPPMRDEWLYEAERDLEHNQGRAEADGWAADTVRDEAGYLIFGPYARDWPEGDLSATFRLMVDVTNNLNEIVASLDVFDAETGEILVGHAIPRSAFEAPFTYQDFTINFSTAGRMGHPMETRVFWHDISYVRADRVVVHR